MNEKKVVKLLENVVILIRIKFLEISLKKY